jgi:hypothetical protein
MISRTPCYSYIEVAGNRCIYRYVQLDYPKSVQKTPMFASEQVYSEARWTRAVREKEIWRMYSSENGRKIVYRCMKFAVLKFLPRKYNEGLFRIDPLVPSCMHTNVTAL